MNKVIFDTNAYRNLVKDRSFEDVEKLISRLKAAEKKNNIEALISPIVLKELLAHLAERKDPHFERCLNANKALYLHSGSVESYNMIASPELLISKAFFNCVIPSKVETNSAFGQISYHLATNPSAHTFKKFQRTLNLNRDHVLDSENNFALTVFKLIKSVNPAAKGWKIFENDGVGRKKALENIRSQRTSIELAAGFLYTTHQLLFASGQAPSMTLEEFFDMAVEFIRVFPEPIALWKYVLETLTNNEYNLFENSRSNFVWDIQLMFNIGNHSIDNAKLHFVTDDKAIIRTAIGENAKYSIWTLEEYLEYLK